MSGGMPWGVRGGGGMCVFWGALGTKELSSLGLRQMGHREQAEPCSWDAGSSPAPPANAVSCGPCTS